ncbi:hypothetical protein D3C81_1825930 [compost metagenome]
MGAVVQRKAFLLIGKSASSQLRAALKKNTLDMLGFGQICGGGQTRQASSNNGYSHCGLLLFASRKHMFSIRGKLLGGGAAGFMADAVPDNG